MSDTSALFECYPCPHLAVVEIKGSDAIAFLQSQLTQDVNRMQAGCAALAGYCTAQGRLLASLVLMPTEDEQSVLAMVSADLVEPLLKRLRMFVLRSKVTLEPRPDLLVTGWLVRDTLAAAQATGSALPVAVWACQGTPYGRWIAAPLTSQMPPRFWVVASPVQHDALLNATAGQRLDYQTNERWRSFDIQAGLPWIEKATQDLFIPQMVNLDLTDGVSFTKGCYPGQEVVARAHYRGTVKRRMHLGKGQNSEMPQPGADVYCLSEGPEPCGRVVNAVALEQTLWVLFEAPLRHAPDALWRASSAQGATLQAVDLPYPLQSAD